MTVEATEKEVDPGIVVSKDRVHCQDDLVIDHARQPVGASVPSPALGYLLIEADILLGHHLLRIWEHESVPL